jgi:hypothetical protein
MNTQSYADLNHWQSGSCGEFQNRPLTTKVLHQQNLAFQGTGGVSYGNRGQGFAPAFFDAETGTIYLARYADGRPAPMHLLDGLPRELVVDRDGGGKAMAVKHSLIAGFVRAGLFYTREQAARCV